MYKWGIVVFVVFPTPGHHASRTNPAGQPTTNQADTPCANTVSATIPISVNKISSPPSHLHLDQTDNFPQMLYSNLKMAELGQNMQLVNYYIYKYSCVFDCHCWLLIYCKFDIHNRDDTPWVVQQTFPRCECDRLRQWTCWYQTPPTVRSEAWFGFCRRRMLDPVKFTKDLLRSMVNMLWTRPVSENGA